MALFQVKQTDDVEEVLRELLQDGYILLGNIKSLDLIQYILIINGIGYTAIPNLEYNGEKFIYLQIPESKVGKYEIIKEDRKLIKKEEKYNDGLN